ncbi:hypothetical protein RIVM261_091730 [Rivularia sp. IAM M-261]|nr:hypothetical protein CAL7716_006580 [Calothrix sp. PCC 7716]GJD24217.1 hypothetical protein RIVM261_091730 [Rivularia sp. IAM M-261]
MKGEILGERYQVEQLLDKKAGRRTFLAHDLQSNQPNEKNISKKHFSLGSA